MNRRGLLALLAVIALVVVAAIPASGAPKAKVGVAYSLPGLGDGSLNDTVNNGVIRAEADFGIKALEMSPSTSGKFADPEAVVTRLAQKSSLVIVTGFDYAMFTETIAAAYPDTNFALIDAFPITPAPGNLLGTTMASNEGAFLVGAAAALMTETGQVGFIGGVGEFFPVAALRVGFIAGVDYVNSEYSTSVAVREEYLSVFPDLSGFSNVEGAFLAAQDMYAEGVDVIFHAAGYSGFGVFSAARAAGLPGDLWAIGCDFDQYFQVPDDQKPYVLTSMVKRFDNVTYDVIRSQVEGEFAGGTRTWGLADDGVDYSTSGGFLEAHVFELEAIRAGIISGAIAVPLP